MRILALSQLMTVKHANEDGRLAGRTKEQGAKDRAYRKLSHSMSAPTWYMPGRHLRFGPNMAVVKVRPTATPATHVDEMRLMMM